MFIPTYVLYKVSLVCQAPLLVLDYKWPYNPVTEKKNVTELGSNPYCSEILLTRRSITA